MVYPFINEAKAKNRRTEKGGATDRIAANRRPVATLPKDRQAKGQTSEESGPEARPAEDRPAEDRIAADRIAADRISAERRPFATLPTNRQTESRTSKACPVANRISADCKPAERTATDGGATDRISTDCISEARPATDRISAERKPAERFIVTENLDGLRLDRALVKAGFAENRSQALKRIQAGGARLETEDPSSNGSNKTATSLDGHSVCQSDKNPIIQTPDRKRAQRGTQRLRPLRGIFLRLLSQRLLSQRLWSQRLWSQRQDRQTRQWKDAEPSRTCNRPLRASYRLKAGEVLYLTKNPLPPASKTSWDNQPLDLLYEDEEILVVNKPAGIVTHPAPGHESDTLLDRLILEGRLPSRRLPSGRLPSGRLLSGQFPSGKRLSEQSPSSKRQAGPEPTKLEKKAFKTIPATSACEKPPPPPEPSCRKPASGKPASGEPASGKPATRRGASGKPAPVWSGPAERNRAGVVHRLDKDVSGALVFAKTARAEADLISQFKARSVKRIYWALTLQAPKDQEGFAETYIGRHPVKRKRFISSQKPMAGGKKALTFYKVLSSAPRGPASGGPNRGGPHRGGPNLGGPATRRGATGRAPSGEPAARCDAFGKPHHGGPAAGRAPTRRASFGEPNRKGSQSNGLSGDAPRCRPNLGEQQPGGGRNGLRRNKNRPNGSRPNGFAWLECRLQTGRTHQIRLHLSSLGCPVIGDRIYGGRRMRSLSPENAAARRLQQTKKNAKKNTKKNKAGKAKSRESQIIRSMNRTALHARFLAFKHPVTKKKLSFSLPWPDDLQELVEALGFSKR